MNNTFQWVEQPIYNALVPKEGPRAVPLNFDFAAQPTFDVDLQNIQSRAYISIIQTIFVDNSQNDVPLSVLCNLSRQKVFCPPHAQGFFPVLVPLPPKLTISCNGGTVGTVILLNVPMPASMWSSQQFVPNFDGSGNTLVTDTLLATAIANGLVATNLNVTGDGGVVKPFWKADQIFTGTKNTVGNTNVHTGNPGWFITNIDIGISGDAALAAAGNLTVKLLDNTTVIAQTIVSLPAAAGTGIGQSIMRMDGLNVNSKFNALNLNINLSAALTSGFVWWNIAGGDTAIIG